MCFGWGCQSLVAVHGKVIIIIILITNLGPPLIFTMHWYNGFKRLKVYALVWFFFPARLSHRPPPTDLKIWSLFEGLPFWSNLLRSAIKHHGGIRPKVNSCFQFRGYSLWYLHSSNSGHAQTSVLWKLKCFFVAQLYSFPFPGITLSQQARSCTNWHCTHARQEVAFAAIVGAECHCFRGTFLATCWHFLATCWTKVLVPYLMDI